MVRLQVQRPTGVGFRSVILSPTKELAAQIHSDFKRLCKGTKLKAALLKKANAIAVSSTSNHKYDILVATPLRLVKMIQEKTIDVSNVIRIVFDEADKLFDPTFIEQIGECVRACARFRIVEIRR